MQRAFSRLSLTALTVVLANCSSNNILNNYDLKSAFVEVNAVLPDSTPIIETEIRYFTDNNFVGERIAGYNANKAMLTIEAAQALSEVQTDLARSGMGLKIFDAYRPQRAVDHFVRWAMDIEDTANKQKYYPNVKKSNLFHDGYIAEQSGHSRGSTVDLTIINLESGKEIDMGSPWDFFDPISWPSSTMVSDQQRANRKSLQTIMLEHGFRTIIEEWWHFTLEDEPFPDTYFDFAID